MTAGLLELTGTLDTAQFWPSGRSDADTATVIVNVTAGAIKFRKNDSVPFQTTHVFDNAFVRGRIRKAVIRNGRITIRLQGIDAPELHYQPSALTAKEKKGLSASKIEAYHSVDHLYRQPMGATTTKALHDLLASSSNASLQCRIFTQIDGLNEAFDTYGRLVGDIEITSDGNPLNLNDWLVENGWAFPTFYSSMTNDEINKNSSPG